MYDDNCFNFETDIINDEGKEYDCADRVDFSFDDNHAFARAYYRDELKAKGLDPDYQIVNR